MQIKQILLCLVTATAGCHSASNTNSNDTTTIGYSDSSVQVADSTHPAIKRESLNYKVDTSAYVTHTLLQPGDTAITIDMHNNKGNAHAYLNGKGKRIIFVVPVTTGDSLTARIIPDDKALNIHFKQIYIPVEKTGKYDGPFSKTVSYPITVKGDYQLIVGSNLMQEGITNGGFTCEVIIK